MKFQVFRTSKFCDCYSDDPIDECIANHKPCNGAIRDYLQDLNEPDKQHPYYYIEINSLEELVLFCKEHDGRLVIHHDWDVADLRVIEIYDAYRE